MILNPHLWKAAESFLSGRKSCVLPVVAVRLASSHLQLNPLKNELCSRAYAPDPIADATTGNTLRAAVIDANTPVEDDTITLQAGTYTLAIPTSVGQENAALEGDLDLTQAGFSVTIQGRGRWNLRTIDADAIDRVFQVFDGVTVNFIDLTIIDGRAVDDGLNPNGFSNAALGGGILNDGGTVDADARECRTEHRGWCRRHHRLGRRRRIRRRNYSDGVLSISDGSFIGNNIAGGGDGARVILEDGSGRRGRRCVRRRHLRDRDVGDDQRSRGSRRTTPLRRHWRRGRGRRVIGNAGSGGEGGGAIGGGLYASFVNFVSTNGEYILNARLGCDAGAARGTAALGNGGRGRKPAAADWAAECI
jgi:hypothetical protein